jgi:hypothetical protein
MKKQQPAIKQTAAQDLSFDDIMRRILTVKPLKKTAKRKK